MLTGFSRRAFQNAGGISSDCGIGGNVSDHDRTRADNRPLADCHSTQNCYAAADAGATLNQARHGDPVSFGLQRAPGAGRAWMLVVNKSHAMSDEDLIFNGHPFADKSVTGDFAITAYARAFLNFDERADLTAVPNLAPIEIDEVMNDYVATEFYVGRNYAELSGHFLVC
jgi:hypothetical protein